MEWTSLRASSRFSDRVVIDMLLYWYDGHAHVSTSCPSIRQSGQGDSAHGQWSRRLMWFIVRDESYVGGPL